jgi:hypothetical protein
MSYTSSDMNDEQDTAPIDAIPSIIPGIPNESETTANDYDEITAAIDRAQLEAARRRDELAAIAQGNTAVLARVLRRMDAEAYIHQQLQLIVLDLAALTPGAPIPDYLHDRAYAVSVLLGQRPGDPIRASVYFHGLTPPAS